jgi:hypothetical protein
MCGGEYLTVHGYTQGEEKKIKAYKGALPAALAEHFALLPGIIFVKLLPTIGNAGPITALYACIYV